MTLDKRTRREMLAHCADLHEDDGVDPRDYFAAGKRLRKPNRKALQLCRQVADTLGLVISGVGHGELLGALRVVAVEPPSGAGPLRVTVAVDLPPDSFDPDAVLKLLRDETGWLRSEIAAAITRRRVPKLMFRLAAPPCREEGQA